MHEEPAPELLPLLDRVRNGDIEAKNALAESIYNRLSLMTRKMLRQAPNAVNRWEQTGDLLHAAWFRVERVLNDETIVFQNEAHFFRTIARHLRYQLIDLYRSNVGPRGIDANHASVAGMQTPEGQSPPALDPQDRNAEVDRIVAWGEFHEQVEELPEQERAVTDLIWYQGFSHEETAKLLGVSSKTVQRTWRRARIQLGRSMDQGSFGS